MVKPFCNEERQAINETNQAANGRCIAITATSKIPFTLPVIMAATIIQAPKDRAVNGAYNSAVAANCPNW